MTAPTTHGPTATELMELLMGRASETTGPSAPSTPQVAQLSEGDRVILREFANAKQLEKLGKELKEAAELKIRDLLGDAVIGTIDGVQVVKVNSGSNSRLDSVTVRDGWPEAYEAAKRTTDYTYLSVDPAV